MILLILYHFPSFEPGSKKEKADYNGDYAACHLFAFQILFPTALRWKSLVCMDASLFSGFCLVFVTGSPGRMKVRKSS